jgi:hypothetical protein
LIINGKSFHASGNLPDADPLNNAIKTVIFFQEKNETRYVPEDLWLDIFSLAELNDAIKGWLPKPHPVFQKWQDSPLFEYGEGWHTITGKDLPKVMAQFNEFPGFRVYQDSETKLYYIAAICANYNHSFR